MEEQPIRVAHIIGKMVGGGVESFIMNYYRNIDRSKIQFDFIIDSDSTVVPRDEIEKLGGRIIEIPPYQKIFSYIKELKKVFKNNNYKIVHSHLNSLSVFPLYCAFSSRVPVRIAHSHSTTNRKEWKKNIIKNILKHFSKVFATDYFACSEHAARWLFGNKTFEKGEVTIIHNAIDVEKFKYNEGIRKKIRKELKIDNKLVLGHVGRFVQQKNHDFLIKVFAKVYKENKNTILLLIGEGPLEEQIRKKVKKYCLEDVVYFLGVRNDVNELMQAMDVFVFPSLYEGLGMALIEAQCSNLPCVISNKVPEEAVINDNVFSVNLNDIKKWKEYILNLKNDREKETFVKMNKYDIAFSKKELEQKYKNFAFKGDNCGKR